MIKMAFRNLFRFKRRTLITFSAVAIGLALLIIALSLLNGIDRQSLDNIVNSQAGFLTVFREGYFEQKDDLPLGLAIAHPQQVQQAVAGVPGVKAAESRLLFAAGLIKGADELPCLGVGIETERDPLLFDIRQSLARGEWLKPNDAKILVGTDLAAAVDLAVGDEVTLRMVTSDREEQLSWNALDVEVAGIFDTGNPATDSQMVIMPLALAQSGVGLGSSATEIAIRLTTDPADLGKLAAARTRIQSALAHQEQRLQVYTWRDVAGIFEMVSKVKKRNTSLIVFVILVIAAIGIVNTMLMAVMERTREIGMLGAMGMRPGEIIRLFLYEGGFIGVFGSLCGCLLGGLGGWYLQAKGLSLSGLAGEGTVKLIAAFYPLKDVFYGHLAAGDLAQTFLLGTFVAVAASLYPAWKAARLDPAEAMRHV